MPWPWRLFAGPGLSTPEHTDTADHDGGIPLSWCETGTANPPPEIALPSLPTPRRDSQPDTRRVRPSFAYNYTSLPPILPGTRRGLLSSPVGPPAQGARTTFTRSISPLSLPRGLIVRKTLTSTPSLRPSISSSEPEQPLLQRSSGLPLAISDASMADNAHVASSDLLATKQSQRVSEEATELLNDAITAPETHHRTQMTSVDQSYEVLRSTRRHISPSSPIEIDSASPSADLSGLDTLVSLEDWPAPPRAPVGKTAILSEDNLRTRSKERKVANDTDKATRTESDSSLATSPRASQRRLYNDPTEALRHITNRRAISASHVVPSSSTMPTRLSPALRRQASNPFELAADLDLDARRFTPSPTRSKELSTRTVTPANDSIDSILDGYEDDNYAHPLFDDEAKEEFGASTNSAPRYRHPVRDLSTILEVTTPSTVTLKDGPSTALANAREVSPTVAATATGAKSLSHYHQMSASSEQTTLSNETESVPLFQPTPDNERGDSSSWTENSPSPSDRLDTSWSHTPSTRILFSRNNSGGRFTENFNHVASQDDLLRASADVASSNKHQAWSNAPRPAVEIPQEWSGGSVRVRKLGDEPLDGSRGKKSQKSGLIQPSTSWESFDLETQASADPFRFNEYSLEDICRELDVEEDERRASYKAWTEADEQQSLQEIYRPAYALQTPVGRLGTGSQRTPDSLNRQERAWKALQSPYQPKGLGITYPDRVHPLLREPRLLSGSPLRSSSVYAEPGSRALSFSEMQPFHPSPVPYKVKSDTSADQEIHSTSSSESKDQKKSSQSAASSSLSYLDPPTDVTRHSGVMKGRYPSPEFEVMTPSGHGSQPSKASSKQSSKQPVVSTDGIELQPIQAPEKAATSHSRGSTATNRSIGFFDEYDQHMLEQSKRWNDGPSSSMRNFYVKGGSIMQINPDGSHERLVHNRYPSLARPVRHYEVRSEKHKRGERFVWVALACIAWFPFLLPLFVAGIFDEGLIGMAKNEWAKPNPQQKRVAKYLMSVWAVLIVAGIVAIICMFVRETPAG